MTRTELLQKLKAKRKELADREGVELFMVLTNKALEETVKAMPQTLQDLVLVKGWGKTKIAKYGSEMLAIIHGENNLEAELPLGSSASKWRRSEKAIFSVSEFLETVTITLARLGSVRVRGEISEFKQRDRVVYFVLKDKEGEANVKCVLFAWKYEREYTYLEDGMEIIVDAVPEIYAKFGTFNLRVERVEPVGEGALSKAFEALKKKLEEKGYFEAVRKRPIPAIIQRIGVVTSEKGEAINDFLKNVGSFGFEIVLMDVRVEGDRAEESIVGALQYMNRVRPDLDVLCLIRGGGGLENLRAFNTERVAHAVISSRIPVLTGIGHERDQTIVGFSSDADFSTPTKVADAIRRGREDVLRGIDGTAEHIISRMEEIFHETARSVESARENMRRLPAELRERTRMRIAIPAHKLEAALGRIFMAYHQLEKKFTSSMYAYTQKISMFHHVCMVHTGTVQETVRRLFQIFSQRVAVAEAALILLNPVSPLERGYSLIYRSSGKVVKNAEDVIVGEQVMIRLYKGKLRAKIDDKS